MAFPRIGGPTLGLTTQPLTFSTLGVPNDQGDNVVTLAAGQTFNLPAGTFLVQPGPYTFLQWKDPVPNVWRTVQTAATTIHQIDSDGGNYRLANLTGCVIGAAITTGGAGWTNAIGGTTNFSSVSCSGSPTFSVIVGGALSTSGAPIATTGGTGQTAGSGFTFLPTVVIDPPPQGGIQATAVVTLLSGTGLSASGACLTYTNQGAGYTSVPNITIIPDPRDLNSSGVFSGTLPTVTGGALTGSGVVTGILVTNHGSSFNASGGAPSITFTSGGVGGTTMPTATAIMCWTLMTGANTVSGGTFLISNPILASGQAAPFAMLISSNNAFPGAGTALNQSSLVVGNPAFETQLVQLTRPIRMTIPSSGQSLSTGTNALSVEDFGLVTRVPTLQVVVVTSGVGFSATLSGTSGLGGVADTSVIQRI